jgi:hypothetical protein
MKKGVIKSFTFFGVGILATIFSYLIFDHSYAHGPSLYHLIALLTFFGSILWTIGVILRFLLKDDSAERKGIILTNLTILIGTCLTFYLTVIRPEQNNIEKDITSEKLTTTVSGDTTTMDISGRIIYIKVKDSVYLDFTDSIK